MNPKFHVQPPRWTTRLLRWFCAPHLLNEMEGDLDELFSQRVKSVGLRRARWRYVRDVLSLMRPFALKRKARIYPRPARFSLTMLRYHAHFAWRNSRQSRLHSLLNVFGLTTGIACFLLVMLFVQYELGYDRSHLKLDHIYRLEQDNWAASPAGPGPYLVDHFPQVKQMVRFHITQQASLVQKTPGTYLNEKRFWFADSQVFDLFTFPFVAGDPATALAAPFSVVITRQMAHKYFGQANPLGKTLRVHDYHPNLYRVTGVMEDIPLDSHLKFDFLASFSSMNLDPAKLWGNNLMHTYVELAPGTDPQPIERALAQQYDQRYPEKNRIHRVRFTPARRIHLYSAAEKEIEPNSSITYLYVFGLIGVLIVALSCINFINLTTARALKRAKEVGIRKAIGATRGELMEQFLLETVAIAGLALLLSVGLVYGVRQPINHFLNLDLSLRFWGADSIFPVLMGIFLFVSLTAGLFPAYYLSGFKPSRILTASTLTESPRSVTGRARKWLVVGQFTISIGLVVGVSIIYSQLAYLRRAYIGLDKEQVISLALNPQAQPAYAAFKDALLQQPVISAVTASITLPGQRTMMAMVEPEQAPQKAYEVHFLLTDVDFVETYGVKLSRGRSFTRSMLADTAGAWLINQKAAQLFGWSTAPNQSGIGKQIYFPTLGTRGRVVGVTKDFNYGSLHAPVEPLLIALSPNPSFFHHLSIRFGGRDAPAALRATQRTYEAFFPGMPFDYAFADATFGALYQYEDRLQTVIQYLMLISVFLSCIGLFSLAAFDAQQKTRQIGVRKAFGASTRDILVLMTSRYLVLLGIAFVLAVPLTFLVISRWLQRFAYRTDIRASMFLAPFGLLLLIALITVSYQVIRAARQNPVKALKHP